MKSHPEEQGVRPSRWISVEGGENIIQPMTILKGIELCSFLSLSGSQNDSYFTENNSVAWAFPVLASQASRFLLQEIPWSPCIAQLQRDVGEESGLRMETLEWTQEVLTQPMTQEEPSPEAGEPLLSDRLLKFEKQEFYSETKETDLGAFPARDCFPLLWQVTFKQI